MKRFVVPVLLVAASAAVYLPTLKWDFVIDDERQIELMESRFTWSQVPSYFTTDVWSYLDQRAANYYRPIFVMWLMLTYQLAGLSHPLWHASAILTHALATLLLYFLARRLTGEQWAAGIAALMFAVDPVHLEGVAWVSGATEPLCAIFFFATLLCYLAARQEPDARRARWWRWASVAAFALTAFSKETGVVLPALILVYAWLFPEASSSEIPAAMPKKRARAALLVCFPYLQTLIVYLAMRYVALGGFTPRPGYWGVKSMLETLPVTAWFYMRELLWPLHLSIFPPVTAVHSFGLTTVLLPAIGVAVGIGVLLWVAARGPLTAFCSAMVVAPLLPVLALRAFPPEDFVHDRYLYIPTAGVFLLLALALRRWVGSRPAAAQIALIAPLIAVLAFLTIRESEPWKDSMTLARHAMEVAPDSMKAQELLSSALWSAGRYREALPLLDKTLAAYPDDPSVQLRVASCYLKMEDWNGALPHLHAALALTPNSPQAHLLLGLAEEGLGQMKDAEAEMREAVRDRPRASVQFRGYRASLAELLEQEGDLQGALEEYNREFEEYPDEVWVFDRAAAVKREIAASN
jgi:protein O-mannosyl-transferase